MAGYVPVSEEQLARATVEPLSPFARTAFRLRYPASDGMDDGERVQRFAPSSRNRDSANGEQGCNSVRRCK